MLQSHIAITAKYRKFSNFCQNSSDIKIFIIMLDITKTDRKLKISKCSFFTAVFQLTWV